MINKFTAKYIAGSEKPVFYVTAKDISGLDSFYFLLSSHKQIESMLAQQEGEVTLSNYGIIIESGYGIPTKDMLTALREQYNLSV